MPNKREELASQIVLADGELDTWLAKFEKYHTTEEDCQCPDFQIRGVGRHTIDACKHMLAFRLRAEGEAMNAKKQDEEPVLIPQDDPPDVGPLPTVPMERHLNTFFRLGKNEVFDCQYTLVAHGISAEEFFAMWREDLKGLVMLGAHAKAVGQQAQHAPSVPQPADAVAAPPPVAPPPAGPPEPEYAAVAGAVNTARITEMTVEPDLKDLTRTHVGLWAGPKGPGHEYADINIWTVEQALKALAGTGGWNEELMRTPKVYAVNWDVDWVPSEKLNKYGKPYKNIVSIRVIA